MEIKIGPYIVTRRTSYSKLQLLDAETGENITDSFPDVADKIFEDYTKQTTAPENYFEIANGFLMGFKEKAAKDERSLEYIFLPNDITFINKEVFSNSNIIQVSLPSSLTHVNESAFSNCKMLKYIDIPDNIKTISACAFKDCVSLETVKFPAALENIQNAAFEGCIMLNNVDLPKTLNLISHYAFAGCESLSNINFPEKLRIVGTGAFLGCNSLERVDLTGTIKRFDPKCFMGCASLKEIILPEEIYDFGGEMFAECPLLEKVKLPSNMRILEKDMFVGCESLTNIEIPEELSAFDINTFSYSNLKSLTINHDITKIEVVSGSERFKNQTHTNPGIANESNIKMLIIDGSVKEISPVFIGKSGEQITKIDFRGTKKQFDEFKNNNKKLFKLMPNINNIKVLSSDKNRYTEEFTK